MMMMMQHVRSHEWAFLDRVKSAQGRFELQCLERLGSDAPNMSKVLVASGLMIAQSCLSSADTVSWRELQLITFQLPDHGAIQSCLTMLAQEPGNQD